MASSGVGCSLGLWCWGRGVWARVAFSVVCAVTFRVDPLSVRGGRPGDCVIGCCTLCSGD